MTWIHPFFLVGLAAAALPILLHFFGRRPARVVPLPTVEILRRAVAEQKKRSRLREILLALVRAAFLVAVTLAAARPLLSTLAGGGSENKTIDRYVLLDNSASMLAETEGVARFEIAKRGIRRLISNLPSGGRMALVPLIDTGEGAGLTDDPIRLERTLDSIAIAYERGAIFPRLVSFLSERSDEKRATEVWIVTDGTSPPWSEVVSLGTGLFPFHVWNVAGSETPPTNRSLRFLGAEVIGEADGAHGTIRADVGSSPGGEPSEAILELRSEGGWKEIARKKFAFTPAAATAVEFSLPLAEATEIGRIRIANDYFRLDNEVTFALSRLPAVSTILIGNPVESAREKSTAYFVATALRSLESRGSPFRVEISSEEKLGQIDWSTISTAILVDGGSVSPSTIRTLDKAVREGMGLLTFFDDSFEAKRADDLFRKLLPQFPRVVRTAEGGSFSLLAPKAEGVLGFLSPGWEAIAGGGGFRRIFLGDPAMEYEGWLRFENGVPALSVSAVGRGKSAVWAGGLDESWSDLPLRTGFPSLMRKVVAELARPEPTRPTSFPRRPPGSMISPEDLGLKAALPIGLRAIDGTGDERGVSESGWVLPSRPGIWTVAFSVEEKRGNGYAVTEADPAESDFTPVDRSRIEKTLHPHPVAWIEKGNPPDGDLGAGGERSEKSANFGLFALLFFILESCLAGRLPGFTFTSAKKMAALLLVTFVVGTGSAYALGSTSRVEVAQVLYDGGNPTPYRRPLERLLSKANDMTSMDVAPEIVTRRLSDPRLNDHPLLYWAGDRAFPLPLPGDLARLRSHLEKGGLLFIDDAIGSAGGGFETSAKNLLAALFPGAEWAPVAPSHAIFRSFFLLEGPAGRRSDARLSGFDLKGRTALFYFSGDLAGALAGDSGDEAARKQALRFGVNWLMVALTLDYKQDQIHIPFILNRRKS